MSIKSISTIEALVAVKNGADIWGYALALKLREIEREHPELITICKAMAAPKDGAQQQPYFGCICTDAGRDYIANREGGVVDMEVLR